MNTRFWALVILTFSVSINATAQYVGRDIENNQCRIRINSSGSLFWDQVGSAKYNADIRDIVRRSPIFMSTLWMGGLDENRVEYAAAQTYLQSGQVEFTPGPISNSFDAMTYENVWQMNSELVELHKEYYQESWYEVPEEIASWPAHGNADNGEPSNLAPFVDLDEDGKYSPEKGDYPKIQGDFACYIILSEAEEKKFTKTEPGGFEVHCLAYLHDRSSDEVLNNTVFLRYRVFNRSSRNYSEFYLGQFNDFELGSGLDDLVGCDPALNLTYTYNGDDFDDGAFGYGSYPPAFGCTFLNKDMTIHQTFDENISTIDFGPAAYDYLSGKKLTGENFEYDGDPVAGTGSLDSSPNDRTTLSSFGPFEFKAGTSICFNMAFVYARDRAGEVGPTDIVGQLKKNTAHIRDFYKENQGDCFDIYSGVTPEKTISQPSISLSHNLINIQGLSGYSNVEVFDLNGRLIISQSGAGPSVQVSANHLPKGLYVVKVESEETLYTQKLILGTN